MVNSGGGDYWGFRGMLLELLVCIEKFYGFDKLVLECFWLMIKCYLIFDFGEFYYCDKVVSILIVEWLLVFIFLGLWSMLIIYLVVVLLGIKKVVCDGSCFDVWSSIVIIVGYVIFSFLIVILLVVLFVGGFYWEWFLLCGLILDNFD